MIMAPHTRTAYTSRSSVTFKRRTSDSAESSASSLASGSDNDSSGDERKSAGAATARGGRRTRSDSVSSVSSESSVSSVATTASLQSTLEEEEEGRVEASTSGGGKKADKVARGTTDGGVSKKRIRRAPRLTARKRPKREYKPRKDAVAKVLREESLRDDFLLADLDWSPWKCAIQQRQAVSSRSSHWEPRLEGRIGMRHHSPFPAPTHRPAVYEVAVKVPGDDAPKIPVLGAVRADMSSGSWEAALLSKPKLRKQVDRVLRRGCKLYVRQAALSARDMPAIYERSGVKRNKATSGSVRAQSMDETVSELRGLMARVCDYAWREHYDIPSRTYSHRRLVVNNVKVSDK